MTQPTDPYLEERSREILAAARTVFIRYGFERATMQQIAAEVGLSAGALYRYFPSKEALITRVCGDAGSETMLPFGAVEAGRSAFEVLLEGGAAIWTALATPEALDGARMLLEATVAGMRHPESVGVHSTEEMAAARTQLAALIRLAQEEGSLDASVDATALASLLIGVTHGIQVLAVQLDGDVDRTAAWELLRRMVEGLRPEEANR